MPFPCDAKVSVSRHYTVATVSGVGFVPQLYRQSGEYVGGFKLLNHADVHWSFFNQDTKYHMLGLVGSRPPCGHAFLAERVEDSEIKSCATFRKVFRRSKPKLQIL